MRLNSGFMFSQVETSTSEFIVPAALTQCTDGPRFDVDLFPEVVLATLLPALAFELTNGEGEEEITWNFSVVNYPTMGREGGKPEMRLKVRAL